MVCSSTLATHFLLLIFIFSCTKCQEVSVIYDVDIGAFEIKNGSVPNRVAWANFTDKIETTGWSFLEVVTNASVADEIQAYAAGLAEGYLTADLLYNHWMNTIDGYCKNEVNYCDKLKGFLNDNLLWMKGKMDAGQKKDPYWHQVQLILEQMTGMQDGYAQIAAHRSKILKDDSLGFGFLMFNIGGDLEDLEAALKRNVKRRVIGSGSCSALIKVLPGNRDLLVAQDAWTSYQSMLRILKQYTFHFHLTDEPGSPEVPGYVSSFSSYPGSLGSGDDFILLSSGLVTLETTIGNGNASLWKYVQPKSVLEWIRALVANRLAVDGSSWSILFTKYNSGTYNNQWMIVDYKKFSPGQATLKSGLLWVVEQLPKFYFSSDVTDVLRNQSYWPSYNSPYSPFIFNMSGNQAAVDKFGDWFTYDKTPRALIFKRDHVKVTDIKSLIKLMRYNDFQHDPLSKCNCTPPYSAENAISARNDLNPSNGTYPFGALGHRSHGGIDMKGTNWQLMQKLEFVAVGGPTFDPLPAFQWSLTDFGNSTPHFGHPDLWRFDPVIVSWASSSSASSNNIK